MPLGLGLLVLDNTLPSPLTLRSTKALLYGSSFSSKGAFALPSIVLKIKTMWHLLAATTRQHTGRGKGVVRGENSPTFFHRLF